MTIGTPLTASGAARVAVHRRVRLPARRVGLLARDLQDHQRIDREAAVRPSDHRVAVDFRDLRAVRAEAPEGHEQRDDLADPRADQTDPSTMPVFFSMRRAHSTARRASASATPSTP